MGIDVKRFVDNVNQQFICGICSGVLQEPIMVKECQHVFCATCIRNQMRTVALCPLDNNLVSFSHLIESQKLVIDLLNDLKLKCEFSAKGCEEVVRLGDLNRHQKICSHKQVTSNILKCICGQELTKSKELDEHRDKCLDFIKNEIQINRSQISTFIADVFNQCNQKVSGKKFTNETEYLYQRLSQSLPQRARNQTSVQNILLYLNWRLLEYKPSPLSFEQIKKIKLGLRDLTAATHSNMDAMRTFIRSNGLDYILLIHSVSKSRDLDEHITTFLLNFQVETHLKQLIDRSVLDMILVMMNPKTRGMENSFNCVEILCRIVIKFENNWNEVSSAKEKIEILNRIKGTVSEWKLNAKLKRYGSFKQQICTLKNHIKTMPSEVVYRYVWVLVYHTRSDPKKHVPTAEELGVQEFLTPVLDNDETEDYIKDLIRLLFHQIETFKSLGHLNGLENSDKRAFAVS